MFLALVTKNSVRKTGVRQVSRMSASSGHFTGHLLSLRRTSPQNQGQLISGRKRTCLHPAQSRNPREGSDWPSVGHMPIFRSITAVSGWDIMPEEALIGQVWVTCPSLNNHCSQWVGHYAREGSDWPSVGHMPIFKQSLQSVGGRL